MNDRNTIRKAKFEINCENIQDFSQRLTESFITWYFWSIVANFSSDIFKVEPFQLDLIRFFCRAWFFCKSCHDDVKDENLIKKCKCKNCKFWKSSLLQVFDSWIELRTKSFSASFSCYSVPYNSEITLKILFAPLVAKFRTGVRAIQLVGRASESAPKPLLGWKFWPKIWTSHFGQKF